MLAVQSHTASCDRTMPHTTPRTFNDAAIGLTAVKPVRVHARGQRLQRSAVARALALLLLTPAPALALELGEASVRSALGQPLLVDIPYRLAGDERLTPGCIALARAPNTADALPTYSRASRITVRRSHIEIVGESRVLEPLIGLTVDVHCATAPRFVRSYELFVDPPARAPALAAAETPTAPARLSMPAATASPPPTASGREAPSASPPSSASGVEATTPPRAAAPSERARGHAGGSIAQGQTYLVVRGDTLSGIAARVADRGTIKEAVEAIFVANPEAFAGGNRDLIVAGRSITIPLMTSAATAVSATPVPAPRPAAAEPEFSTAATEPTTALAPVETPAPQATLAENAASIEAPAIPPPSAAATTAVDLTPASIPVAAFADDALDAPPPAVSGRSSRWLIAMLAVGLVIVLVAAPLVLLRRRKQQAEMEDAKPRATRARQRPVDPVAGIEVVESTLARAPAPAKAAPSPSTVSVEPLDDGAVVPTGVDDLPLTFGPTDSVDIDVGAPVVLQERVDWFANRADAAAAAAVANTEEIREEDAATLRMADFDITATVRHEPRRSALEVDEPVMDDEQLALTNVELEMLRQDYEAEHTMTQQANKALRDAVAELHATEAARAAAADAATVELPHQQTEANSTTARRRAK
jgi:hypothetical protein